MTLSMPDEDESLASSIPRQISFTAKAQLPSPSLVSNIVHAQKSAAKSNPIQTNRSLTKREGVVTIPVDLTVLSSFSYTLTNVDDDNEDDESIGSEESSVAPQEFDQRDDGYFSCSFHEAYANESFLDLSGEQPRDAAVNRSQACMCMDSFNAIFGFLTAAERDLTTDTRSETDLFESSPFGVCAPCSARDDDL